MITITVKNLELTNHDPRIKLTTNFKAETTYNFSQRRTNLTKKKGNAPKHAQTDNKMCPRIRLPVLPKFIDRKQSNTSLINWIE